MQGAFEAIQILADRMGLKKTSWTWIEALAWTSSVFNAPQDPGPSVSGSSVVSIESEELPLFVVQRLNFIKRIHLKAKLSALTKPKRLIFDAPEEEHAQTFPLSKESIAQICLRCHEQLAPEAKFDHLIFKGSLCSRCYAEYCDSVFELGNDGMKAFCFVCGHRDFLVLCSFKNCFGSFCKNCIGCISGKVKFDAIIKNDNWRCFFCSPSPNTHFIKRRQDWKLKVFSMFEHKNKPRRVLNRKKFKVIHFMPRFGKGTLNVDALIDVESYSIYTFEPLESKEVVPPNYGGLIKRLDPMVLAEADIVVGTAPSLYHLWGNEDGLEVDQELVAFFFKFFKISVDYKFTARDVPWIFESPATIHSDFKSAIIRFFELHPLVIDSGADDCYNRFRFFWSLYNFPKELLEESYRDVL